MKLWYLVPEFHFTGGYGEAGFKGEGNADSGLPGICAVLARLRFCRVFWKHGRISVIAILFAIGRLRGVRLVRCPVERGAPFNERAAPR